MFEAGKRLVGQLALVLLPALCVGCGTTRVTDTSRTATEQLLISNAVDRSISQLDFRILEGKRVFCDTQYLDGTDKGYVISSLRQHLLASGCLLQEQRENATYVVEARAGAIGTDRNSVLLGVPQMNLPVLVPGMPSTIPEIPLIKKTDQKGTAKIGVFAYNRLSGRPIFQSGTVQSDSSAKDLWVLGTGPLQKGTIRKHPRFAGQILDIPYLSPSEQEQSLTPVVDVTRPVIWTEPEELKPETKLIPVSKTQTPAESKPANDLPPG